MNVLRFVMMMKGGISRGLGKRRKGEVNGFRREGRTLSSEKSEGLEGAEGDGGEELEVQGGGRAEEGEERDGRRKSCGVEGRGRLENKGGGEEVAGAGRFGDGGRRVVEEVMGGEREGGEVGSEREGGGGGGGEDDMGGGDDDGGSRGSSEGGEEGSMKMTSRESYSPIGAFSNSILFGCVWRRAVSSDAMSIKE
ncbi:unnamed protein product [Closterium sp. NIES-64]|nr:unnamed protein product [Closterium sp. NIES-64]